MGAPGFPDDLPKCTMFGRDVRIVRKSENRVAVDKPANMGTFSRRPRSRVFREDVSSGFERGGDDGAVEGVVGRDDNGLDVVPCDECLPVGGEVSA